MTTSFDAMFALDTYQQRLVLLERGLELCQRFLRANPHVKEPQFGFTSRRHAGYYVNGKITINLRSCQLIGRFGRSWSAPGYPSDATPYGVAAHEMGHHAHFTLPGGGRRILTRAFRLARQDEAAVTSYGASQVVEDVAEAFKLFLTNPTLLEAGWPIRYRLLRAAFVPVEERHWREVLAYSPRHLAVMEKRYGS